MKSKCISIKRLKIHEFNTTIRLIGKEDDSWVKRSTIYSSIQEKAIKHFLNGVGKLLLAYLIATSLRDGNVISIKISNFEASLPASYYLFAVSLILLFTAVAFNHLSCALTLKVMLAGRLVVSGFSANMYDLLNDHSENSLGIATFQNGFLKEVLPVSSFLSSLLVFGVIAVLIPIAALAVFLFVELTALALNVELGIPERLTACAGALIALLSGLYVLLFHIPLPMKKNATRIRWRFLYNLPPHPSDDEKFARWLDKK